MKGYGGKGGMQSGMKDRSPSSSDKSTVLKGPSVDSDATRSQPSEGETLGPRTA